MGAGRSGRDQVRPPSSRRGAQARAFIQLAVWIWCANLILGLAARAARPAGDLAEMAVGLVVSAAIVGGTIVILAGDPESASFGRFIRGALRNWVRVASIYLPLGVITAVGIVALVIPGVIAFVRLAPADVVGVTRDVRPLQAIRQTWWLTRGNWGACVLALAVEAANIAVLAPARTLSPPVTLLVQSLSGTLTVIISLALMVWRYAPQVEPEGDEEPVAP